MRESHGVTECYTQSDNLSNHYASAICCQLREVKQQCVVGDIIFSHGDSTGVTSETCTDETSYTGTEGICNDGQVVRQPYNGECDSGLKCCQSGEPGTEDGATCISSDCDCNAWVDPSYVLYDPCLIRRFLSWAQDESYH